MKKKLLAALLTVAMVVGLAACGSGNSSSGSGSGGTTAGDSTESGSSSGGTTNDGGNSGGSSDIVTITYMTTGDAPSGGAKDRYEEMMAELNKLLEEKVGAHLDIYFLSWTDYLSNYNLVLASMDGSVDLVGTASDWLDAWPNAKKGAFLELSEDMLQTYAPQTWASVPAENWELCKYDGEIYLMPEDNYAQWTNHGYIYRLDWAKEAGLADGVHSWEDMTTYWRYVKDNHCNENECVVPWDSDGTHQTQMVSGWIASHSDYVSIDGINAGAMWGGKKGDLYTVYSPYMTMTDELVEYAKLMKEWDEIGVWYSDVLSRGTNTNRDDYRVGKSGADQHHTQTWTDLVSHTEANKIYQDDPNADTGFFYFGEESKNIVALSITHGAMAISAGSRNPEKALQVYDLLRNDPEIYRLFNYGIQGISWDVNDEGLKITPAGYNSDTDNISGIVNFWWGRNDDLEIKDATRNWDEIDKLYAEYDKIKIEYPYGQFVPDVDEISDKINNISEIHDTYMKQISYGKYSGSAEDIVAEYQAALKAAGIDDVTAELQRQFDELYK